MSGLSRRLDRLTVIYAMISRHAADLAASRALLAAYASTLRSTTSKAEVAFRLRIGRAVYPFRMRKGDIFVLEEVLLQGQYQLDSKLPPRPTIVDAGANIGVASLWLLAAHAGASIHAFEPAPDNLRLLRENLGGRTDVVINQACLGREGSTVMLHLAAHGAMHSVVDPGAGIEAVEVPCVPLAEYLAAKSISRVDLLKLDVEGSELDVLKGLGSSIETVQVIAGEVHETLVDEAAFYAYLSARGFRLVQKRRSASMAAEHVHLFEASRG